MTSERDSPPKSRQASSHAQSTPQAGAPGWADGLRKLYDSVVDEPIPDSFKDLLSKLDDVDSASKGEGGKA